MNKTMRTTWPLLLCLALSACGSTRFANRSTECDPDQRLAELMRSYERCRDGKGSGTANIALDCDRFRNEIERLSLEFPVHVPTLMANAVLCYDSGERIKSQRYLDSLLSLQPVHPEAAILRARVGLEDGNLPLAQRLLEQQITYVPDHAGAHEALSSVHYLKKDLVAAEAEIALAERLGAPGWRVAFNRGLIAEAQGDRSAAQRHYQAAVDANPGFQPARSRLAGTQAGVGYTGAQSAPQGKGGG